MKSRKKSFFFFLLAFVIISTNAQTTLIPMGSAWKYLDNGSDQNSIWKNSNFDDTLWTSGNAELGYGDGGETTVVSYGPSSSSKYITTYFRKTFTVADASLYTNYSLNVKRDDGVVVYVNGNEVYRNNMPTGTITYATLASAACSDDGNTILTSTLPAATFNTGSNTIAIEIHQNAGSSSDISFNLSLMGNTGAPAAAIQHIRWGSSNNPLNGLTCTWRNTGLNDLIKWGYTNAYEQGTFPGEIRNGYADKFFKYTFPSLTPDTTIYYQLFDSQSNVWTTGKTYKTAPPVNTTAFSFLAIGDSRSGMSIWNQVSNLAHAKDADFTIFNGDIVNNGGSNTDWDDLFTNGNQFVENNLVYHSMGNHDAASVPTYQNVFELPQSQPTGGTNLYYSFTYGNAVFIALNSEDPSNITQYNWLVSTLQANQSKTWKIIFFHRPFYTIGNHAGEMNSYYNTWWKAFDDYGVDLIVNGHDHMYERTKPINRNSSTTTPVTSYGSEAGQGRCQIVCGGAGAPLYTATPTWFVQTYQSKYNFCKFDVDGNNLCNTTFDNNGNTIDSFCLTKTSLGVETESQVFYPIKIIPNPVKDIFTLEYNAPIFGIATIKIYDLAGREIVSEKVNKEQNELKFTHDVSKYPKGVYTVVVTLGNQKDSSLLVIE
jgi:hypothetical protein